MTTTAPTLLDAALTYAKRGWHVFPCHTPTGAGCSCRNATCANIGKHPRTRHGLHDATTDTAIITRWWATWPTANIAIRTGVLSGLVVLDLDAQKGGEESLADLEHSYTPLPETVLSLTGNGRHYLFQHPGHSVKNGVDTLGPGLDIRGDGGYIIAPPSLHASGRRYAWEIIHDPEDMPLAPLPAWLLALCQASPRREAPRAGDPILNGQRNDTLFRMGCGFRARGCTEAVILAALREMNATQCQSPLTDEEVAQIAASCAAYEAGVPKQGTPQTDSDAPPPSPQPGRHTPALPLSDYTNALALVQAHGDDLRYCEAWKKWLHWTGTHWDFKAQGPVLQKAKHTIKHLLRRAADFEDEEYEAWLKHIKRSLSTAALKAMVESAQNEPGISIAYDALNQQRWLLPCANGTLDLHTGALRPHCREDLLTECLAVPYDPAALCPQWKTFLWRILGGTRRTDDTETMSAAQLEERHKADERARALMGFVQRLLGCCLTADVREQNLYVFYGTGANGKSTLLGILLTLLGHYAMKAAPELLMSQKDNDRHPTERADLFGKRVVAAIETEQGRRLNETLVKELTGGDPIRARRMREDFWEFLPTHKLILATNHKPEIRGTDHAIWRRIKLVPFTVTIPDDEQDHDLPAKLLTELPGILAWMVRGCLAWQRQGLGAPESVVDATSQYRHEQDVFEEFITTECHRVPSATCTSADLYTAYERWCKQNDIDPLSKRAFGIRLGDSGFTPDFGTGGRRLWRGIGLHDTTGEKGGQRYGKN